MEIDKPLTSIANQSLDNGSCKVVIKVLTSNGEVTSLFLNKVDQQISSEAVEDNTIGGSVGYIQFPGLVKNWDIVSKDDELVVPLVSIDEGKIYLLQNFFNEPVKFSNTKLLKIISTVYTLRDIQETCEYHAMLSLVVQLKLPRVFFSFLCWMLMPELRKETRSPHHRLSEEATSSF